MATDYDAPVRPREDLREEGLEELKARRADKAATLIDVDEVGRRSRRSSCRVPTSPTNP